MNTVSLVKKHLNRDLYIDGVVCTMYDVRTNLSMQVVQEVKNILPIRYTLLLFRAIFAWLRRPAMASR